MGMRGKPPILGFLVIERFRCFPAGGRMSFSCCGNIISCRWCVTLSCVYTLLQSHWPAFHTHTSSDLLSMRMPSVIMVLTLAAASLEDVKLLNELSSEVSVQFLSLKYMRSVLLTKPKGVKCFKNWHISSWEKKNIRVYTSRPCNQSNYAFTFVLSTKEDFSVNIINWPYVAQVNLRHVLRKISLNLWPFQNVRFPEKCYLVHIHLYWKSLYNRECGTFVLKLLTTYSCHWAVVDMTGKKLILQLGKISTGKNISSWLINPWDKQIKEKSLKIFPLLRVDSLVRCWEKQIDFQTTIYERNTEHQL